MCLSWLISILWAYSSCEEPEASDNYKMKISWRLGFEQPTCLQSGCTINCVMRSDTSEQVKCYLNLLILHGRCSRLFCCVLQFVNTLESANVFICQAVKLYKFYMTTMHLKLFCYIHWYHMV